MLLYFPFNLHVRFVETSNIFIRRDDLDGPTQGCVGNEIMNDTWTVCVYICSRCRVFLKVMGRFHDCHICVFEEKLTLKTMIKNK